MRTQQARAAELIWLNVGAVFDPLQGDPRLSRMLAELRLDG